MLKFEAWWIVRRWKVEAIFTMENRTNWPKLGILMKNGCDEDDKLS